MHVQARYVVAAMWWFLFAGMNDWFADRHKLQAAEPRAPDFENVSYGPATRNKLDYWKAESELPTPLLVFIHGGSFVGGDKSTLPVELLNACLAQSISVMAINYRLSPTVIYPNHYLDCARAIQFVRSKAKEWNIDSTRVAASGDSAGGATALWIGFHDDLADLDNRDPVLRQSTRLTCMVVRGAQSTLDPWTIQKIVGGTLPERPVFSSMFFGLKQNEVNSVKARKLYTESSAITHVNAGDPPVYMVYSGPKERLPANPDPGDLLHHINFGIYLKEKMDPLKIECVVRHTDEDGWQEGLMKFLMKHLHGKSSK